MGAARGGECVCAQVCKPSHARRWHFRSEVLLRSPSAKTPQGESKTALKEKFVAVYQALFSNQDPSGGARALCVLAVTC